MARLENKDANRAILVLPDFLDDAADAASSARFIVVLDRRAVFVDGRDTDLARAAAVDVVEAW